MVRPGRRSPSVAAVSVAAAGVSEGTAFRADGAVAQRGGHRDAATLAAHAGGEAGTAHCGCVGGRSLHLLVV